MSAADTVRRTIAAHGMIKSGEGVIAGLSGGADSVCLLRCLCMLREELDIRLTAVHVNHCLRGEESERDMRFCQELCRELDVPLKVYRVNVREYSEKTGMSTEEAARALRYKAFEEAAEETGCARIATAHNKCDSSETVLFNLTRGTGIRGMRGIPYVRGRVIRPLLDVTRQEIEEMLRELGQDYVTDSSNNTDDYSRNIIRHRVVPVLESVNGGFFTAVSRLSAAAAEDEEYFAELIRGIPPEEICRYPASVRKRYIRGELEKHGLSCSFERLAELDGMMTSGRDTSYSSGKGLSVFFSKGVMRIAPPSEDSDISVSRVVNFNEDSEIYLPEFDKTVKITGVGDDNFCKSGNVQKKLTNCSVNYVKIQGVVTLRNKRDGDRIMLAGRDFTTKLKKYYNALKLSREERLAALVMEDEQGLIWSEYGGAARRVVPEEGDPKDCIRLIEVT